MNSQHIYEEYINIFKSTETKDKCIKAKKNY